MASVAPQAVGGALLTLPAQLTMASVSLKLFPWVGVLCARPTRPSCASRRTPELFMPGAPPQSQGLCSVVPFHAPPQGVPRAKTGPKRRAGRTYFVKAGTLTPLCADSRSGHARRCHPPPRSVFLCLCNLLPASVCLLVLLVLESAPDSLSGYNSRVLSLTHICLGTACVGLSRDGSTSWARLLSSSRCACPSGLCAQAKGLRVVLP